MIPFSHKALKDWILSDNIKVAAELSSAMCAERNGKVVSVRGSTTTPLKQIGYYIWKRHEKVHDFPLDQRLKCH